MEKLSKTQKLLDIASKTLAQGSVETAKEIVVLAMQQEDAIDALDKLLPHLPSVETESYEEEETPVEEETLTEAQVARILSLTKELNEKRKFKIVNQILSKLEKVEESKKRKKK